MNEQNETERGDKAGSPLAGVTGSAAGGRYYALVRGRGIPYDMGGGREEVPWELDAKTYDAAEAEAKCRYGDNLIRVYLETRW